MFQVIRRTRGSREPSPVNSEQLQLELGDARVAVPWDGTSPRALTRCAKLFSLKAPPARVLRADADPAQLTLFLKGNPYGSR